MGSALNKETAARVPALCPCSHALAMGRFCKHSRQVRNAFCKNEMNFSDLNEAVSALCSIWEARGAEYDEEEACLIFRYFLAEAKSILQVQLNNARTMSTKMIGAAVAVL